MSALLMGRAFYVDLPPGLKLTLLALADHANDDGTGVMVGQERLAAKVGVERHSIGRYLARLRELGYIERTRQAHGPGRGRRDAGGPDHYRVVVEMLPTVPENMEQGVPCLPAQAEKMEHHMFHEPSDITSTTLSGRDNGDISYPLRAPKRTRERDALFEAVYEATTNQPWSPDAALTRTARGALNAAVRDLREVGATPEEVRRAAAAWPALFPGARCTPHAIAKHWHLLVRVGGDDEPAAPALSEEEQAEVRRLRELYEREEQAWLAGVDGAS